MARDTDLIKAYHIVKAEWNRVKMEPDTSYAKFVAHQRLQAVRAQLAALYLKEIGPYNYNHKGE